MTYKQQLQEYVRFMAQDPRVRFIGYNTAYGHRFNGTLDAAPVSACIEMPVAENLIMGVAIGMALEGWFKPVVCLERMDFLWACADALINHLDKAKQLGWPPLPVLIRVCVGSDSPIDPGCQHKGDYYSIFKQLLKEVEVRRARTPAELGEAYDGILDIDHPIMIVEYRDMYKAPLSYGVK